MLTLPVFLMRRPTRVTPAHATARSGKANHKGAVLALASRLHDGAAPMREARKHRGARTVAYEVLSRPCTGSRALHVKAECTQSFLLLLMNIQHIRAQ